MRLLGCVGLAVLLLAGCLGGGSPDDSQGGAPADGGDGPPRLWPTGHGAGEPTLALDSQGTLYMGGSRLNSSVGDSHVGTVLRSRDGGRSWDEVTPRLPDGTEAPPFDVDPIVYVDPATDRLFFLTMFPQDVCGFLAWSDDAGESWSYGPAACASPPIYDHPTIVAAPSHGFPTAGYPTVLHMCYNRVSDVWCARSPDGGLTWVSGAPPFLGVEPNAEGSLAEEVDGVCGALTGHLAASADGILYLPKEHCLWPFLAISTDDGTTWRQVQVSDVATVHGPDPAVAVDAEGNVHYLFIAPDGRLYLSSSRDHGLTWTDAAVVSDPRVTATQHPALAASGTALYVAYVGTDGIPGGWSNEEFSFAAADRLEDGAYRTALWHAFIGRIADPFASVLRVEAHVATPADDPLIRGKCDLDECSGGLTHYNDVVALADGSARAAYVDVCQGTCATSMGTWQDNDLPGGIGEAVIAWWPGEPAP